MFLAFVVVTLVITVVLIVLVTLDKLLSRCDADNLNFEYHGGISPADTYLQCTCQSPNEREPIFHV